MSECKECSVKKNECKNCSQETDIREDFCSSCLVVPLALVGASATGMSLSTSKKNKMRKKILLVGGIVTIVSAVAIGIYYLMNKKNCLECKLKK